MSGQQDWFDPDYPSFTLTRKTVSHIPRIKANFLCEAWPVEVFGQPIPVRRQNAYRHMQIEARLLFLFGRTFREQVIELKRQGLKKEPAFSRLLWLDLMHGIDPYQALLELEGWSDESLIALNDKNH
ncbi:DUF4269 domain-containing protein [Paenibacillus physcomitrellae]|uniref:Uncharacterized protein n=1 Tax=Paenibacillus physcomitrellae TaxID=1619311 RepID=A0ABQ1GMT9_9BACL|nr:DUF4269 domain-containing protein [Paenibacillus physcomitrellae]GGA46540.1 hypothetical protein GCM10010917_34810 [Paenibacillus physcomitrellae]